MLQLLKNLWGNITSLNSYANRYTLLDLPVTDDVLSIRGIDIERLTASEMEEWMSKFANAFRAFPKNQNYKIVIINRQGYARVTPPDHPQRTRFLKRYEEFVNKHMNVRKRSIYLLTEDTRDVSELLQNSGVQVTKDKNSFYEDLRYFFKEHNGSFVYPVTPWKYGVKIGPRYGVTLMHLQPVEIVHPFFHQALNYIYDDYIFCLAFWYPPVFEIEQRLQKLLSAYGKKESRAAREVEHELAEILRELTLGREVMVYTVASLTVFGDTPRAALSKAKAVSVELNNAGISYEYEGTCEYEIFKILFNFNTERAKQLGVVRKYPLSVFVRLLPFSKCFQGVSSGELYFNSAGEPVYVDTYKTASMHCTTLGHTGAGKSMLAQYRDLYTDMLVVIEKIQEDEGSYRYSVPFFGGKYAPLTLERPMSLNAFGKDIETFDIPLFFEDMGYHFSDFSEKEIIFLRDILDTYFQNETVIHIDKLIEVIDSSKTSEGAYLIHKLKGSQHQHWNVRKTINRSLLNTTVMILGSMIAAKNMDLKPEDISIIEKAALQAYRNKPPERVLTVSDVVTELSGIPHGMRLAERLRSFTLEGRFGLLFDAPPDIEGETNIYYELRINETEVLIPAILSILYHTLKTFSHPAYHGKRKKVRLDEAWFFIAHPLLSAYVNEMIRTYRKKGIEIDFDSQMASDFTSGEARIIAAQCEHNFFLFNKQESMGEIQSSFQLTDEDIAKMKAIKPPAEYGFRFSRLFLKATYGKGVLTYLPSRELYWLATTRPADKVKREEVRNKSHSMEEAVLKLAQSE